MVYIDHNLGTLVKDAFVVAEPLAAVADGGYRGPRHAVGRPHARRPASLG